MSTTVNMGHNVVNLNFFLDVMHRKSLASQDRGRMTTSQSQELHDSLPQMQPVSTTVNMGHSVVYLNFFLQVMHRKSPASQERGRMTSGHSQELHSLPHIQPMSTTVNMCQRVANLIFFLQGMHRKQTCMVGVPGSSLHPVVSRVPTLVCRGEAMRHRHLVNLHE